jgi:pSer/pThr/pTyr-binding forkhead associated (FHA) protein
MPAPQPMGAEAASGAASARLEIAEGARKGAGFLLGPTSLVIGRSRLANVRLTEPDVAEFHAHVAHSLQRCHLTSLSGPAGTKVNGLSVFRQDLNEGDNLSVGSVTFAFHVLGAGAAPGTVGIEPSLIRARPGPRKETALRREAGEGAERASEWDIREEVEVEPMPDLMMRRGMNLPSSQPPAKPAPKAYKPGEIQLTCIEGPLRGKKLPLAKPSTVFGRGRGADIELPDELVSRRHAEIVFGPKQAEVRDLGSHNGTFLNGARVTATPLRSGDSLRIGASVIVVEEVPEGQQPPENP